MCYCRMVCGTEVESEWVWMSGTQQSYQELVAMAHCALTTNHQWLVNRKAPSHNWPWHLTSSSAVTPISMRLQPPPTCRNLFADVFNKWVRYLLFKTNRCVCETARLIAYGDWGHLFKCPKDAQVNLYHRHHHDEPVSNMIVIIAPVHCSVSAFATGSNFDSKLTVLGSN